MFVNGVVLLFGSQCMYFFVCLSSGVHRKQHSGDVRYVGLIRSHLLTKLLCVCGIWQGLFLFGHQIDTCYDEIGDCVYYTLVILHSRSHNNWEGQYDCLKR